MTDGLDDGDVGWARSSGLARVIPVGSQGAKGKRRDPFDTKALPGLTLASAQLTRRSPCDFGAAVSQRGKTSIVICGVSWYQAATLTFPDVKSPRVSSMTPVRGGREPDNQHDRPKPARPNPRHAPGHVLRTTR